MTYCEKSVGERLLHKYVTLKQKLHIVFFLPFLSQPGFFLWDHDQQVAVCLGEDIFQLDWHRAVRVDSGCSAGSYKPRLWLSCAALWEAAIAWPCLWDRRRSRSWRSC